MSYEEESLEDRVDISSCRNSKTLYSSVRRFLHLRFHLISKGNLSVYKGRY